MRDGRKCAQLCRRMLPCLNARWARSASQTSVKVFSGRVRVLMPFHPCVTPQPGRKPRSLDVPDHCCSLQNYGGSRQVSTSSRYTYGAPVSETRPTRPQAHVLAGRQTGPHPQTEAEHYAGPNDSTAQMRGDAASMRSGEASTTACSKDPGTLLGQSRIACNGTLLYHSMPAENGRQLEPSPTTIPATAPAVPPITHEELEQLVEVVHSSR